MKIGNVVSLFDGMSCGQLALSRAGIKYENYFASEIDKYAIQVAMYNYPDTIQLGDVTKIRGGGLPKIDLLLGGSPCQGFSQAGKRLNFDDPRSKLFFEYVRLLKKLKPKYFLLENVKMKLEQQDIISKYLGVQPIKINSNLTSAQSRNRLYWTNIPNVTAPDDKGILMKDIIELDKSKINKSLFVDIGDSEYVKVHGHKSRVGLIMCGGIKSGNAISKASQRSFGQGMRVYSINGKGCTINANGGGWGAKTGLYLINKKIRKLSVEECERMQNLPDGYVKDLSWSQSVKMIGNGWTIGVVAHILKGLCV